MDGRGREVLPGGWEGSEVPPECWVSLIKCREGLGGLPAGPGGVGRPSQMVGKGREAHSDCWGFGSPPKRALRRRKSLLLSREGWVCQKRSRVPPGPPGGAPDHSQLEGLLEGRKGSGCSLRGPGGVGNSGGPSRQPAEVRRAGRVWETLSEG